jgi:hypothetical protein
MNPQTPNNEVEELTRLLIGWRQRAIMAEMNLEVSNNDVSRLREQLHQSESEAERLKEIARKIFRHAWDNVPHDYDSLYNVLDRLYEEIETPKAEIE